MQSDMTSFVTFLEGLAETKHIQTVSDLTKCALVLYDSAPFDVESSSALATETLKIAVSKELEYEGASELFDAISNLTKEFDNRKEAAPVTASTGQRPAVPIEESVQSDYIVCLEDGRKMKMLKRHLRTMYDMSPEDYRAKWGLSSDYPMTAPNYAKTRSRLAREVGLGAKVGRGSERGKKS